MPFWMWGRWYRKWYCNVIDNDCYADDDDDVDGAGAGWQWLWLLLTGGCVVIELKRVVYRVQYNYQMGKLVLQQFPNWRTLYT